MKKNLPIFLRDRGVSEKIVLKISNLFGNLVYNININNFKTVPTLYIDFDIESDIIGEIFIINDKDFYISFYSEKYKDNKFCSFISNENISFAVLNEDGLYAVKGKTNNKILSVYYFNNLIINNFAPETNYKQTKRYLDIEINVEHEMLNHFDSFFKEMGIVPEIENIFLDDNIFLIPYLMSQNFINESFSVRIK